MALCSPASFSAAAFAPATASASAASRRRRNSCIAAEAPPQFPAQSAALLEALDRAFVGVGVVTVDDDGKDTAAEHAHAVASASAARRCRALQIASQLGVEHNRKSLAAWEFEIRASVGTRVTVPRVIVGRHPTDNLRTAYFRSDFGGLRVPTAAAWSYSLRGGFADPWRPIRRLPLSL